MNWIALMLPLLCFHSMLAQPPVVSWREFVSGPADKVRTEDYLKRVLFDYWHVRLDVSARNVSAAEKADPETARLADKEKNLEAGIRGLLFSLIHTEKDKQELRTWAKRERISIPWNFAPKKLEAAS